MIKTILLTGLLAGSITYNVTDAFEITKSSVTKIVNIYAAAAQISPYTQNHASFQMAQNNLHRASLNIQPLANMAHDIKSVSFKDGGHIFSTYGQRLNEI